MVAALKAASYQLGVANQALSEFGIGAHAIAPLAIGVAVYGLAFGLLASQAGFSASETGLMGGVVLAGSAQIIAVERIAAGAGVAAAVVAGIALNLRLALITASMRDLFAGRPLWQKVVGAHVSTDENWALLFARRAQGEQVGFWFLVGSGAMLALAWIVASMLGVTFASHIPNPNAYAIDFAFTAAFIAICRSLWRGSGDFVPWLIAISVVLISTQFASIEASWAIVFGGVSGSLAAALLPTSNDD